MTAASTDYGTIYASGDRAAFFAAIVANQDDAAPKLVFADWLEERGFTEEGAAWRKLTAEGWKTSSGGIWNGIPYVDWPRLFQRAVTNILGMYYKTHGLIRFVAAWCEHPELRPE